MPAILAKVSAQLAALHPGGALYDSAMRTATDTQLKNCVQRIHTDGIASDGSAIGQYSTTPMYVNPTHSPSSFQPIGKTGKTVFAKTGQPHRTKYFDAGYKAYRQEIGLAADKVVLTLRGDLRDGLAVIKTASGYGLGWADSELYDLSQALEKKYAKPIWVPTAGEREEMANSVKKEMTGWIK